MFQKGDRVLVVEATKDSRGNIKAFVGMYGNVVGVNSIKGQEGKIYCMFDGRKSGLWVYPNTLAKVVN